MFAEAAALLYWPGIRQEVVDYWFRDLPLTAARGWAAVIVIIQEP
jgi:hypothetical protein